MPANVITSVENNFTKGLVTEFTGLNFPENAATDTANCTYTLVGDVTRRLGINRELNGGGPNFGVGNTAYTQFVWDNVGGDGTTSFEVAQIGSTLLFYNITASTVASPLSNHLVGSLDLTPFITGASFDATAEAQYASGNGYLFVFHSSIDTIYVTYSVAQGFTSGFITVKIRDFAGLQDNLDDNTRPSTLSIEHQYNLQNQGWTSGTAWGANVFQDVPMSVGTAGFIVGTGLVGVTVGQNVSLGAYRTQVPVGGGDPVVIGQLGVEAATVSSYTGGVLTLNIYSVTTSQAPGTIANYWTLMPNNTGYINTWLSAESVYPSNSDVWWYFKDPSGNFNPAVTQPNVTFSTGAAPKGHYILKAFYQDRATAAGIVGPTVVTTPFRSTTGAWFQGRVWYAGANASQQATGDANYYSWAENIFFSQVVQNVTDFGKCYQNNDPTSENLFDLLPTDGGVISIHGCGGVIKLFPIQNGMLVFAKNGVWFITGSQGIGFSASDYTVTKISSVRTTSASSFVDVLGLPYFWNEEGIYRAIVNQTGGLAVEPLTVGTILTYYNEIPFNSKLFAKGAYDPINYVIQWTFKNAAETSIQSRYAFDTILNFNTYNQAFFPYTIDNTVNAIHGVSYVSYLNPSVNSPQPGFKYHASYFDVPSSTYKSTFAEEYDTAYVDWGSLDYESFFVTGYKVHGKGLMKFSIPYIVMYSRQIGDVTNGYTSYKIQGIWDFTTDPKSGRWSTLQLVENNNLAARVVPNRLRIRGRGYTLQIRVASVSGKPFDIIGWAVYENLNASV